MMRVAGAVLVGLLVADCSSVPQNQGIATVRAGKDPKYGVAASPRVVAAGQPVPKGGGVYMVGRTYRVAGRAYTPRENPRYSAVGTASWYGDAFHGRLTANGEVFDKESLAVAHPTLPLPSYVRVTNMRNGRSIIARVNDRGPYHGGRVVDVSQRVAEALDFKRAGTARVKVDYVGRASLNGSDDRKLLATLRDDGAPAGLNLAPTGLAGPPEPAAGGRVLVAAADPMALPDATPRRVPQTVPVEAEPEAANEAIVTPASYRPVVPAAPTVVSLAPLPAPRDAAPPIGQALAYAAPATSSIPMPPDRPADLETDGEAEESPAGINPRITGSTEPVPPRRAPLSIAGLTIRPEPNRTTPSRRRAATAVQAD